MDPITHTMAGVAVGAAASRGRKLLWPLVLTGVLAAQAPDLDAPLLYVLDAIHLGGPEKHWFFEYHRVLTHAVLMLPLLAAAASLPAWIWLRRKFLLVYLTAFAALVSHLVLDWVCDWPIMFLWPFSHYDFSHMQPLFDLEVGDTSIPVMVLLTLGALGLLYFRSNQREDVAVEVEQRSNAEADGSGP